MSDKNETAAGIEKIVSQSGLHVYGTPLIDVLGNKVIIHESSVPAEEGGPYVWLTLQQAGETEGVGVLLDENLVKVLGERLEAAREVWE